ncbi:GMC oxidoreductase-domain-containing protein [Mycena sp. CBHHK59/15]|nr:GMC oxidoreductase-domain-containing protein [Mycena sp. CBHHK59/15]
MAVCAASVETDTKLQRTAGLRTRESSGTVQKSYFAICVSRAVWIPDSRCSEMWYCSVLREAVAATQLRDFNFRGSSSEFRTTVQRPEDRQGAQIRRLCSGDPHARPLVDLGFFTDPADYIPLRKGIKLCLRLAEDVRRQGYPMKAFQVPSSEKESDVDQFIRATIRTSYHYASSCKMASRQEGGVVDDELRVYGVRGLRVCDASVFPCITTAHTQAPVVAVAEKCADLMKI